MSSALAWECSRCTYRHSAPGTRCVMCNELRVTKDQMRDFVMGKTLPPNKKSNGAPSEKEPSAVKENQPPAPPASSSAPKPAPAPPIRNPYAKKAGAATAVATVVPTKPPPSNGIQSSLFTSQQSGTNESASGKLQQARSHSAASTNDSNSVIGNSSISSSGNANSFGQRGPAPQQTFPQKRPPYAAAGNPNQQAWGNQSNNVMGGTTSNVARAAPQKPPPSSTAAQKKNPFTLSVRPTPTPYTPGPVPLCAETASDWVYPIHESYPIRDYQLEISQTAVLYNTLVSLPTGLGKTLIASVVLYNFYRWFPTGKVIFLAPTLPLVNQQVKACYDIMGIPAEDTALLTGKVPGTEREGLWKERRVFFCTPQTVQKDIESNRCPANQVVCVVLDEAHKASGAYAYVKVVQHLEEAGAKYRILGLSATPGTGIKAIQEVVSALRIQKIEARLEDDENVKKYIHERHSEIIVVKQVSVVNSIERMLVDLTAPILERLRNRNGLSLIRGNATLTPWCVMRAQKEYVARTNDNSLDPFFFAALSLVQVRSEIRRTGIGMVRTKMLQLRNQPKGYMRSIVKGKEFQAIMDAVLKASSDPNRVNENAEDRKLNNPKLMKLDEILTEHFERARACGNSSRAIVFTQWRESVSEVVSVLAGNQPLLRARHFVGQGKSTGGANKDRIDQSCVSLKGMKQKEQQAVIRDFRDGTYNILVCTCIGEEGLDIGEVDLIVNYDSLRSPIRMIQRVGRTGRKRDGRVVCLVSEGAEEKTMRQSKIAEKTLGRALKKPDSFSMVKSSPMFPQAPILRKVDMSVANDFHLSQVGGNGLAVRTRRDPNEVSRGDQYTKWRLGEAQELQREAMFGELSFSTCPELQSSDGNLPQALLKRLLRARTRSVSTYQIRKKAVPASFGASRGILLTMERKHGKDVDKRALFNGGSRRESGALHQLFPLERSAETASLDDGLLRMSLSAAQKSHLLEAESRQKAPPVSAMPRAQLKQDSPQTRVEATIPVPDFVLAEAASSDIERPAPDAGSLTFPKNPYLSQTSNRIGRAENASQKHVDAVSQAVAQNAETSSNEPFVLPPEEPSSSDDSSSDDESVEEANAVEGPVEQPVEHQVKAEPQESTADEHRSALGPNAEIVNEAQERQEEAYRIELPPEESSSSDGSSDEESDEELSERKSPPKEIFRPPDEIEIEQTTAEDDTEIQNSPAKKDRGLGMTPSTESNDRKLLALDEDRSSSAGAMEIDFTSQVLMDTPSDDDHEQNQASSRPPLGLTTSNSAATPLPAPRSSDESGADLTDTPQVAATPMAGSSSSAESGADLIDTPQVRDAGQMLPPPSRAMPSHETQRTDDDDEVVCSICYDGSSTDSNPIVLCDGPKNNRSCPIAVHQRCYSIRASLEGDWWHCDSCEFRQKQRPSKKPPAIQCYVCKKEDGPLKQMSGSVWQWFHPHCQHTVVDENAFCQYCAVQGGTRCASEGCQEYAHPHCAKSWMIVAYASSATSSSSLSSDEVIGSNMYCPEHKDQVCRYLARVGVSASTTSVSRYVIVPSKFRGLNAGTATIEGAQRKRLRKKSAVTDGEKRPSGVASLKSADESIASVDAPEQKRQRRLQRMKERTQCRFLDLEADDMDSDDDGDGGEEDEARRIEEEEALNGFINDSSQMGSMTQDDLGRLGLSENSETPVESGAVHRRVDVMRERQNQFKTPVFNRRMLKHARGRDTTNQPSTSQAWDQPTPASEPSSQKGLGNMHFIRSVLEHHRNGGEADDIEEMFHTVAEDASPLEEDRPVTERNVPGPMRIAMPYVASSESSDDDEDEEESQQKQQAAVVLTKEQKARIERKRQEALRKLQQRKSQDHRS